ncbi:hypothetical protein CR513_23017, partial [Mucuna pruriens]
MQSTGFENIPSQTIPNPKGGVSVVTLRSGRELPQQSTPQPKLRPINAESKLEANSRVQQQARVLLLPFPTRTVLARKSKADEDLLTMFWRVVINISLLDAIKQIPKYAKFLKELCMHKRKKLKGGVEMGGVVSALIKNEEVSTRSQQVLPKKCHPDLGASINVMPSSIFKSLNFGDLKPIGMVIQLSNKSVLQPLGILEDVLVQVKELIFPTDFYVLDMEIETFGNGSTLILGQSFFMTTRTKIDIHVGTLSTEFDDNLV